MDRGGATAFWGRAVSSWSCCASIGKFPNLDGDDDDDDDDDD